MADTEVSEQGAKVRVPPPLVFLVATLLGVACGYWMMPAPVPGGRPVRVIGALLLLAAGVGFAASARGLFARTGQSPVPWKPSPSLIVMGPYRYTRNPMYLGITLVQLGLGLALDNLWISLFAVPALMVVHVIAVLPEEAYLSQKFGTHYERYLAQVRRYL